MSHVNCHISKHMSQMSHVDTLFSEFCRLSLNVCTQLSVSWHCLLRSLISLSPFSTVSLDLTLTLEVTHFTVSIKHSALQCLLSHDVTRPGGGPASPRLKCHIWHISSDTASHLHCGIPLYWHCTDTLWSDLTSGVSDSEGRKCPGVFITLRKSRVKQNNILLYYTLYNKIKWATIIMPNSIIGNMETLLTFIVFNSLHYS